MLARIQIPEGNYLLTSVILILLVVRPELEDSGLYASIIVSAMAAVKVVVETIKRLHTYMHIVEGEGVG